MKRLTSILFGLILCFAAVFAIGCAPPKEDAEVTVDTNTTAFARDGFQSVAMAYAPFRAADHSYRRDSRSKPYERCSCSACAVSTSRRISPVFRC